MPLPDGHGEIVSFYFPASLSATTQVNNHVLLFTDHFSSRCIAIYAMTVNSLTAPGVANIPMYSCIFSCGCLLGLISIDGLHVCPELSCELYRLVGAQMVVASSFRALFNGGTDRVNHSMAQILCAL